MNTLIKKMKEEFDIILFDSPPVMSVTDPTVLSTIVDGVVLVVKAGATGRDVVQKSLDQLSGVGVKVLGVVLNDVDFQKEHYYYHYYKYQYYYDEEGDKKQKSRKKHKSRKKETEETASIDPTTI
jgi:Mrp family chromosome partitioning ATPase